MWIAVIAQIASAGVGGGVIKVVQTYLEMGQIRVQTTQNHSFSLLHVTVLAKHMKKWHTVLRCHSS